jgi:hypothetical protein
MEFFLIPKMKLFAALLLGLVSAAPVKRLKGMPIAKDCFQCLGQAGSLAYTCTPEVRKDGYTYFVTKGDDTKNKYVVMLTCIKPKICALGFCL